MSKRPLVILTSLRFPGEVVSLSRRTHAFASSLRVPSPYGKPSPLAARDFQQGLDLFSVAEASIVAARCAVYSTAFTVLLVQADRLEVEEDFRRTFFKIGTRFRPFFFRGHALAVLRNSLTSTHCVGALNLP